MKFPVIFPVLRELRTCRMRILVAAGRLVGVDLLERSDAQSNFEVRAMLRGLQGGKGASRRAGMLVRTGVRPTGSGFRPAR
jgi:hypothetical protein